MSIDIESSRQNRIVSIYENSPAADQSLRKNLFLGIGEIQDAVSDRTHVFTHATALLESMALGARFDLLFSAQLYDGYIRTCFVLPIPHGSPDTRMPYEMKATDLAPNAGVVTHTLRSVLSADIHSDYLLNTAILTVNQLQFQHTSTLTVGIIPSKAALEANPNIHSLLTQLMEMNAETIVRQ